MLSASLAEIHVAWARQDAEPMRACVLCVHSLDHGRRCAHPSTATTDQPVATEDARARRGICGPNAVLMAGDWS